MKPPIWFGILALALAPGLVRADFVFTENADIPTGDPVGITPVGTVSGLGGSGLVSYLTVDLNISGGYNGDFYAYLEAPNGATATLLANPGVTGANPFGYGGSGLNVTFSDAAAASLQTTLENPGALVTGTYQPVTPLSTLYGLSGNGDWTLFIADDSGGGSQAVLTSWSLDFNPATVPEPGQPAAMALLGVGLGVLRSLSARRPKK
jgi:subtilisin-like proprotein convertase family protein